MLNNDYKDIQERDQFKYHLNKKDQSVQIAKKNRKKLWKSSAYEKFKNKVGIKSQQFGVETRKFLCKARLLASMIMLLLCLSQN